MTRPVLRPFQQVHPAPGRRRHQPIIALLVIQGAQIYLLPALIGRLLISIVGLTPCGWPSG